MAKMKLFILSLSLATVSCGAAEANFGIINSNDPEDNWIDPNPALSNEINALIKSKLMQINPCTEKNENSDPNCMPVDIITNNNYSFAQNSSLGYRILLIDDEGMKVAAHTRYKTRVLKNIFENENTGEYKETNFTFQMPRAAKEILEKSFENPSYNKIPTELLNPNTDLFNNKFNHMVNYLFFKDKKLTHSASIFNYIANNSPESQFVLIYTNQKKFKQILCNDNLNEDIKLNKINLLFKTQAKKIVQEINHNKISFVSFSKGYSNKRLREILTEDPDNICTPLTNKLISEINKSYFNYYLKPMTTETDAILVQSNMEPDYYVTSNEDINYYSDCQDLKNRIRVGIANDLTNSLPSEGSRNLSILDKYMLNARMCTEMYINFAVKKERPYRYNKGAIQVSYFNIGTEAITGNAISSSNAVPVALSYLIYLKMQLEKENPGKEISNEMLINRLHEKNNFIFDPSLYKQLPLYSLGYLK